MLIIFPTTLTVLQVMYYVEICTLYMYLYNASMQTKLVSYIKLFDSSSLCEFLDSLLRLYRTEEVWNVYIKLSQMTGIQGYKI